MMTKRMFASALATAALAFAPALYAEQVVSRFSGESSGNTAEFSVEAPWIMDWAVSGEPGEYKVIEIDLVNATTGAYEGAALKSMSAGNGVRLFENGGRYFFRVDSSLMHWNIKVIQLTPQEAALYKPKKAGS